MGMGRCGRCGVSSDRYIIVVAADGDTMAYTIVAYRVVRYISMRKHVCMAGYCFICYESVSGAEQSTTNVITHELIVLQFPVFGGQWRNEELKCRRRPQAAATW